MSNMHLMKINKHDLYTSHVKYTSANIYVEYHYQIGLPPNLNPPTPPLLDIEGISIPLLRGGGGLVEDGSGDSYV